MFIMKTVRLDQKKILLSGVVLVILIVVMWRILSSLSMATHSVPDSPERIVVIDAGHGGVDGGAVGSSGVIEKDINLNISRYLKPLLEEEGFTVVMVRESDLSLHDPSLEGIRKQKKSDLNNRLAVINAHLDALVVSIHQNTFTEPQYRGAQMFYGVNHSQSPIAAQYIQDAIVEQLQPDNDRKIKKAPASVFLLLKAKPPMVLVECGFLSNPEEMEHLSTDSYQQQMATAICLGIVNYYNGVSLSGGNASTSSLVVTDESLSP